MARVIGEAYSYDDLLIVPKYNKIFSRKQVSMRTRVTRNHYINLPFVAANMDTVCESKMAIALGRLGGIGIIHRFMTIEEQASEVAKVKKQKLLCAAAIGIGEDYQVRIGALAKEGVDIIDLDVAHGHSKRVGKALDWIKYHYPIIDVMVGNIVTKDAAEYFLSKGADAVKVGVGPGSMCTTRIMTGAGMPQVTAIMDVYEATKGVIPICADGGIKYPGDCVKAIGAGAETIMSGAIFAGTEETPGRVVKVDKKFFKEYRGMASFEATIKKKKLNGEKIETVHAEGDKTLTPYKGNIEPIIDRFAGGLASGMTYMGADTILGICGKADFVHITNSGINESHSRTKFVVK